MRFLALIIAALIAPAASAGEGHRCAALLDELKGIPAVASALAVPRAGPWVEWHTRNVLRNLPAEMKARGITGDDATLMRHVMALHDIGKPEAMARGDKSRQIEFTLPIMADVLAGLGFEPADVRLALALTSHDAIGEYLKGTRPLMDAARALAEAARQSGAGLRRFMGLQEAFYASDAASYPHVRDRVFRRRRAPDGRRVVKITRYRRLMNAALGEAVTLEVEAQRAAGKEPVIVVDMDDTLFVYATRMRTILQRADARHGTRFFSNMSAGALDGVTWDDFIRARVPDPALAARIVAEVQIERYEPRTMLWDGVNAPLAAMIRRWRQAGAHIVFVTGRWESLGAESNRALAAAKVPYDEALYAPDESPYPVPVFKGMAVAGVLGAGPRRVLVAVFDDRLDNLEAVGALGGEHALLMQVHLPRRRMHLEAAR